MNDYVKKETRGRATVFQNMGYVFGETFAMAILFNFTKDLDPKDAFAIAGVIYLASGIFFTAIIKEHKSTKKMVRDAEIEFLGGPKTSSWTEFKEISS